MRRPGVAGSFWPNDRQELLLRAALLDDEASVQAWRTLRPKLDILRLDPGMSVVLPLLYERLRGHDPDEPLLPRLRGVYRYFWYRNQVGLSSLRELLELLDREGIGAVVVGPAALIARYYGRLGVRPLDEPAVLVDAASADAAIAALEGGGWAMSGVRANRHTQLERLEGGIRRLCAVHWRLASEFETAVAPARTQPVAFDSEVDEIEFQGVRMRTLNAADELLQTFVEGARRARFSPAQWLIDAHVILTTAGDRLGWERLVDSAVKLRSTLRAHDALRYLETNLEVPIPPSVLTQLAAAPRTRREEAAHAISGRGGRILRNLPPTFAAHLVETESKSILYTIATFPGELRAAWGLSRARELPLAAMRRGVAAVAESRRRDRH